VADAQWFVRSVTENGNGFADLLPFILMTKDFAQKTVLARADLDHGFMGFELDHEIARLKGAAYDAMPFQHSCILHVFNWPGYRQHVAQKCSPEWFYRECKTVRIALQTLTTSGKQAASNTGFEEIGAARAPIRMDFKLLNVS